MMCCLKAARTAVGCLVLSVVVLGLVSSTKHTDRKPGVKKQGNLGLVFDPPSLDFGDCAVSVVWRQKVNVRNNKFNDKPINILSISGSSLHFHCSFVENRVLEPQANTTFEVAFLSREEGYAEDTFYIHTNRGSFPYRVQARGTANPFLARSLVNYRIPVNASFSPLIHLYNPFASALQVLEMFGSSCDVHLEMPGGSDSDSSIDWWIIPPHQSKAIARVNFYASHAVNLTSFVRIRTNYTAHPHGSLVLPVSVEVTSQPLLYCPQQFLDFGVFTGRDDPPKTLKVFVINAGNRSVQVQNVTSSPPNDGLTVEFSQVKVPPSLTTAALAALVTFNPSKMNPMRTTSGRLIVSTRNGQYKATIGYQITVPTSYLTYNKSSVNFFASHSVLPVCQSFTVANEFPLAVQITHVSLKHQYFIEMDDVKYPVVNPRERAAICRLCLKQLPALDEKPFSVELEVKTNASAPLRAPISVYNGKLTPHWSVGSDDEPNRIYVGQLIDGSFKEVYLGLFNHNPIGVGLEKWNAGGAVLTYLGVEEGSLEEFRAREGGFANLTLATAVRPGWYAVFHLRVESAALNFAVVLVKTEYERLEVVVDWDVVDGALKSIPEPLEWRAWFLDPLLTTEVRLNSTLNKTTTVLGFYGGSRLTVDQKNTTRTVEPMQSSSVARLLNPIDWQCAYPTLRQLLNGWQQDFWNARNDLSLTSSLYQCFESISGSLNSSTIRLTTQEIGSIELQLNPIVQWPRLSSKRKINFPLTETGQQSKIDLKLTNPTSSVILSQILWLEDAGVEVKDLIDQLPGPLVEALDGSSSQKEPFAFEDTDEETGDSMMVYLTPGSKASVGITFNPIKEARYKSVLMIKNNVTGIELISFAGRAQSAKLLIGNKPPGSTLLFEINEQHLRNCHVQSRYVVPSVTVKRTFTIRNKGSFGITVAGFDISDSPCEGYGYRVLNCQLLVLPPGYNATIEIAFTPDFTQTRVERHLAMKLVGRRERVRFKLMATVPGAMIPVCAQSMPRPDWLVYSYYFLMVMCVVVAVGSVTSALIDAHHVLTTCVWNVVSYCNGSDDEMTARGHLLDLRAMAREPAYTPPQRTPTPPLAPPSETKKSRKAKQKSVKTTKQLASPVQQQPKRPPSPPSPTQADTPPRSVSPAPPTPPPVRTVMEETRIFARAVKGGGKKANKPAKNATEHPKANKQTSSEANDRKRTRSPKAVKREEEAASPPLPVVEASPPKKSNDEVAPVDGWRVKSDGSAVPVGKILPEVRRVEEKTLPKPIGFGSQGKPWIAEPRKEEWNSSSSSAAWWPEQQSLFTGIGGGDAYGLRRFDVVQPQASVAPTSSWQSTWQDPAPRTFSPWSGPQLLDLVTQHRRDDRDGNKDAPWAVDDPRW